MAQGSSSIVAADAETASAAIVAQRRIFQVRFAGFLLFWN